MPHFRTAVSTPFPLLTRPVPSLLPAEYEGLERDTSKYFLYFAAIRAACRELAAARETIQQELRMMVLGAGHGRLVNLCLEAGAEVWGPALSVEVLDANAEAVDFLRKCFADNSRVAVRDAVCINGAAASPEVAFLKGSCDLIVTEVFGSFGDNEFLPEIASEASLFGKPRCIFIPCSFQCYCQLFSSRWQPDTISIPRSPGTPSPPRTNTHSLHSTRRISTCTVRSQGFQATSARLRASRGRDSCTTPIPVLGDASAI